MAANLPPLSLRITVDGGSVKGSFNDLGRAVTDFASRVERHSEAASAALDNISDHVDSIAESMDSLKRIGETFLSIEAIKGVTESLTEANIAMQQVHFSLQAALGTSQLADTEFRYLMDTTNRLGVSFQDVSHQYGSIMASGKAAGVTLTETRDLFTALNEAATVFHLSSEQVNAAMLGIEQAFAQGSFRSQELRQQIGQQLPGVFENFANRVKASGEDFNKMLSTGALTVRDYVGTLTQAIHDSYDPTSLEQASQGLNAALHRSENAILTFKAALGGGVIEDITTKGLANFTELLNDLADSPGLKVTQYAIVTGALIALGRAFSGVTNYVKSAAAGAVDWIVENNRATASLATQSEAMTGLTAAAAKLEAAQAALVAEEAKLAQMLNQEATAAARATEAEIAHQRAAIAAAEGLVAEASAAARAAEANLASATASVEAAGAATGLGRALGFAGAAGRGLLAVFGGVPGVIALVVSSLVLFVDWTTDADKATQGLTASTKGLSKALVDAKGDLDKYYAAKEKLANEKDPTKRPVLERQLSLARQQAQASLEASQQQYDANELNINDIQQKLKDAQGTLAKLKAETASADDNQVNFTTGTVGHGPDPRVVAQEQMVLGIQQNLKKALEARKDYSAQLQRAEKFEADQSVQAAKEKSAGDLKLIKQTAEAETSTRSEALEKQKSQTEQVEAAISKAKAKYRESNKNLDEAALKAGEKQIEDFYAKDLALAKEADAKKGHSKASVVAADNAAAKAEEQLRQQLQQMQGELDPTAAAWAKYNKVVDQVNETMAKAEKVHGANKASIEAQGKAIVALAAKVRDNSIAAEAEKDKQAWDSLLQSMGTPADVDLQQAEVKIEKLNELMKKGGHTAQEYQDAVNKIVAGVGPKPATGTEAGGAPAGSTLPHYQGNDATIGGPAGELLKIDQAQSAMEAEFQRQLAEINRGRQLIQNATAAWDAKETALKRAHNEELNNLDQQRHIAELASASDAFAALADATASAYGEQSKQYKLMFALSKAFAIAQSAVSLAINMSKASEKGWPANIALIAQAVALGAQIAAVIKGAHFDTGGYTGDGGKYEPAGVVHKGEGVLSQEDIGALGGAGGFYRLRAAIQNGSLPGFASGGYVGAAPPQVSSYKRLSNGSGDAYGGGMVAVTPVVVNIQNKSGGEVTTKERQGADGTKLLDIIIGAVVQESKPGGKVSRTLEQNFNLQRKGNSYG